MRFALIAGETSGDLLGAALVRGLRARFPDATFFGVAGPQMERAGCEPIESIEALSLMGIGEVLFELPRLFRLRAALLERFVRERPDCVIGIDAPDFNLGLERRARERGLRTVHLVSPTVWAWREGRIAGIRRAVDLMLCIFPFETDFYARHGVRAAYIGHPLADEIDEAGAPAAGRAALGLPERPTVAVLPGSRHSEIGKLGAPFAGACAWLAQRVPDLQFVVPVAKPGLRAELEAAFARHAPGVAVTLLDGRSREAMSAAEVVMLASGTATMECLLLARPMVVGYRVSRFTGFLLLHLGLLKVAHVSMPNLLGGNGLVPEFLQERARPELIGAGVLALLADPAARERQSARLRELRANLRQDAGTLAAAAIAGLLAA